MPDALELALANAASNMPKGEELHLENLDSIADPTVEDPSPNRSNHVVTSKAPGYDPRDVALKATFATEKANAYYERMDAEYNARMEHQRRIDDGVFDYIGSLDFKVSEMNASLINLHQKIDSISTTINTAAQSMSSEPNHNHRSLHEWDDSTLLNELVERENDLMPFYYELLKRIGSPELQKLVMSSMQGKNASMVTLAQLCSALAPQPIPQQQTASQQKVDVNAELARIAAMNADERQMFVDKMNQSPFAPYQTIPVQPQHFGQTAEEYIKGLYTDKPVQNRIG